MNRVVELATDASNLAHELQRERGISALSRQSESLGESVANFFAAIRAA